MRPPLPTLAALLLGAAVLSGCTGDGADTSTPVPEQAEAPYLCPGVPQRGAELATGADEWDDPDVTGEWGDRSATFQCRVEAGEGTSVSVSQNFGDQAGPTEEALGEAAGTPVDGGDAEGVGVASADGDLVVARWRCGETFLEVQLAGLVEGRDGEQDAGRYLASMLPWACGDAPAPG